MQKIILHYNKKLWKEIIPKPYNTLQIFITNKCNLRCKGCFYESRIENSEMSFDNYKNIVNRAPKDIHKIVLMGGEPTLHPDIIEMIKYNQNKNLKTTIYTNGVNLSILEKINLKNVDVRIGVLGAITGEKNLKDIMPSDIPVTIVYMLRKNNIGELLIASKMAETFNCKQFFLSSIRDITVTGNFWKDTDDTVSNEEYCEIVQNFLNFYNGKIKKIHIASRGILETTQNKMTCQTCRFGNIFPNGEIITCPFDIALNKISTDFEYGRLCNKNGCVLQKIILERK